MARAAFGAGDEVVGVFEAGEGVAAGAMDGGAAGESEEEHAGGEDRGGRDPERHDYLELGSPAIRVRPEH